MLGLRNRNRVSVARVGVQHYVNVRAAVAAVDNVVRTDLCAADQLVNHEYFSVACVGVSNGRNFSVRCVLEFGAKDMVFGDESLQR